MFRAYKIESIVNDKTVIEQYYNLIKVNLELLIHYGADINSEDINWKLEYKD